MDFASCGRRMFMASLMVASKFTQDKNYKNRIWANIMGVSVAEINCVELTFLKLIDYQLLIPENLFHHWEAFLRNQIALRKPKVEPYEATVLQKPDSCLRFSPYATKPFSARCKNRTQKLVRNLPQENACFIVKKESKFTLSYLLSSPPTETLSSLEVPNNASQYTPFNSESGYLTP
ncbi:PHO85 cyclin-5 [Basidiobolus ranarum]|uniref:PHO85 cyclin-5 n=1 Tax=Basidiobolus ranarum TaxID=34480 RepID=A0ABR2WK66_9FUNG